MYNHPPSQPYEICEFNDRNLYAALSSDCCSQDEVANLERANYLYRYLRDLDAKIIIIEHEYIDHDYLDDFAAYYVRCFRPYQRRCKRIHFFSTHLTQSAFLLLITSRTSVTEEQQLQDAYLGFVVARPLPDAIIGRTVVAAYPSDGNRRHYTCLLEYTANLYGLELKVRSLAFQEQDTVLAACATVSLWCCFNKTRELFGTLSPTPAEITRAANQVIYHARPIPSRGLIVQQICNAVRQVGLEPEVVHVKPSVPLLSLLYGHLQMGLPVILGLSIEGRGEHAITLAGYSLQQIRCLNQEVAAGILSIPMKGLRIDAFYAHDDQVGPFSRIKVKPSAQVGERVYPVTFEGAWKDEITGKILNLYPNVVIIPVYNKVRVRFLDAQQWLARLHHLIPLIVPQDAAIEWDLHLTTINVYKRSLKSDQLLRNEQLERLLLQQHPRFIWRAYLLQNGVKTIEMLFDATDMERSLPVYHVIWYSENVKAQSRRLLELSELQNHWIEFLSRPFLKLLKESLEA